MLQIGSVIDGKYKILNKIGQGGMSVVYLAMNERANKQWAVKEVRKDGIENFEAVKQGLMAETELLKKLNHPSLPSIVDVIEEEGTFLIVMDYIEGKSLGSILKEYGAQSQEDVVDWAKQMCDVLSYLHSRQPPIIYRDMKPSNIMLKPDGRAMLIDFGTAREFKEKSTEDTTCLGTQGYAAPEQYGGCGQTDARTDIYSLGATMYHLITGHNPGKPPYEMYPIRCRNPALSSGLEEIILRCTQRNPQDRFQSCAELMYALEHYSEMDEGYRRIQNRRWRAFLALGLLTAALGAGAAGFKLAEDSTISATYDAYLKEAETLGVIDPQEAIGYYSNAINLDPSQGEAYGEMLRFFLWEKNEPAGDDMKTVICVFSAEEEQQIRKALGINGGRSRSNEEYLKANTDDYSRFAYDLGIAYFYSYNGIGNKSAARKWLEIAARASPSRVLNEANIRRADNLGKIAGYYDSLNIRNQAGDSRVSYSDYWYDLTSMGDQESGARDNNVNILLIYQEMASQIFSGGVRFRDAGITRKSMEEELEMMRENLEGMVILTGSANALYEEELKQEVLKNVELARKNLDAVFNTDNIGGGENRAADPAENSVVP